jgi:hypothetical protein
MQTESNAIGSKTREIAVWDFKGILLVEFLDCGDPVTAECRRVLFESLRQAIRRKRPRLLL